MIVLRVRQQSWSLWAVPPRRCDLLCIRIIILTPHVEMSHREKAGRATPQQIYKKEGVKVDKALRRPQTYVCIITYNIQQVLSECVKHNEVSDRCPLDADTFLPLNSNWGSCQIPHFKFHIENKLAQNLPNNDIRRRGKPDQALRRPRTHNCA